MDTMQPLFSLNIEQAETLIKSCVKECLETLKADNPVSSLPKYRTRKEVKEIFKLSLPTLDKYASQGLIRSQRIGTRILFSEDDIKEALHVIPNRKYTRR